jgi:hypothetical protein
MSDLTQAAEQALLVLRTLPPTDKTSIYSKAIYGLEKALEAGKQSLITEPVAYCTLEQLALLRHIVPSKDRIALYTAPPEKQTLTDDELKAFIDEKYKKTIFMPSAADKFSLGWYKKGFRDGEFYTKEQA